MLHLTLRRVVFFVAPAALLIAFCTAWSTLDASSAEDAKELLQERRAVLQQVVVLQREAYQRGEAKFDTVLFGEKELLDADLELSEHPAQRIEIHERLAATMQQLEDISARLYQAGQASQADYLKAKAARLRAQADLIRARAKP
jgi:outer membrane protein TolC